jgi:hypothetical protein
LAVDDPRLKAPVERNHDRFLSEPLPAADGSEEFQDCLGEAVLEIGAAETVVVDAQEALPVGCGDAGDHVRRIEPVGT